MVYIVYGGAGYIGSHVASSLLSLGKRVICVDTLGNSYSSNLARLPNQENLSLVTEDDFKYTDCEQVEGIVHAAGLKYIPQSVKSPLDYYENNIGITRRALDMMSDTDCKLFVMISTAAVYGPGVNMCEYQPGPLTPYGKSMLMCEEMIRDYEKCASSAPRHFTILRVSNVYGGVENPKDTSGLVPSLMKAIRLATPFTLRCQPDGSSMVRDFVNIHDVVKAVHMVMRPFGDSLKVYNVGSGVPMDVENFVKILMQKLGGSTSIEKARALPGELLVSSVNIDKIKAETGWNPDF